MNRFQLAVGLLLMAGCAESTESTNTLTLATTTSTRDSGLLDVLVPMFESESGTQVNVVAVGSGQALELGRRGDADVLLTHAPDAEEQFMDEGYGSARRAVMHNDFVIVGPPDDPVGLADETTVAEVFKKLAENEATFISRGDESGTHMKETAIWQNAEVDPDGEWYISAGAGMGAALRMASEMRGYTLSDRSTYLAQREMLELAILFEGDATLRNPYTVIVVSSERHPHVNEKAAVAFADFLTSEDAQAVIDGYGVEEFGESLFFAQRASTGSVE